LALFVTKIFADNPHATIATDDFALIADLFNAWLNFHELLLFITATE